MTSFPQNQSSSGEEEEVKISNRKLRHMKIRAAKEEKLVDNIVEAELPTLSNQDLKYTNEDENSWNHSDQPPILCAATVVYCSHCGFPPDYCDFGSCWATCKPQALSEYKQFYNHHLSESPDDNHVGSSVAAAASIKQVDVPANAAIAAVKQKKKKEAVIPQITIQRVSRAKHKIATVVYGLDSFGVKLDTAAKLFKKQFACGSSAVKGLPGQQDHLEIQGDFEENIDDIILTHFPQIPEEALVHLKPK